MYILYDQKIFDKTNFVDDKVALLSFDKHTDGISALPAILHRESSTVLKADYPAP